MVRPVPPFCECRLSLVCVNNRLFIEPRRDGVKPRWLFPICVLEHALRDVTQLPAQDMSVHRLHIQMT
jgi:hypothetical protein